VVSGDSFPRLARAVGRGDAVQRQFQCWRVIERQLPWLATRSLGEQIASQYVSRNQLLNEGADVYQEQNADRVDILQEYFVPEENVALFLEKARAIIPAHDVDLLNVRFRNVFEDHDAFLRYADHDMFAFVMLFNQPRTKEGDASMERATRELIDAGHACEGALLLALSSACDRAAIWARLSAGG
jgi:hypothetical protein